jgi:hypothetical protein
MEIKVDTTYKNKYRKMSSEELQEYMFFKRRGFAINGGSVVRVLTRENKNILKNLRNNNLKFS